MSNGTSLSFLVYMIYNKSIWNVIRGRKRIYGRRLWKKIKNMKNGTLIRKTITWTEKVQIYGSGNGDLLIAVSIQCFTRLEYAGKDIFKAGMGVRIAGGIWKAADGKI